MGLQGSEVRILSPRPVHEKSHYEVAFFVLAIKVPDSNRTEVDKFVGNKFDRTLCDPEGAEGRMPGVIPTERRAAAACRTHDNSISGEVPEWLNGLAWKVSVRC